MFRSIVSFFVIASAVLLAQDPPFTVRVDVSLVALDVGVTDALGRPVTTLVREDFQVLENGVPQEIRSFMPVETPYSVLMVFDCSSSTEPSWPFLVDAMNRFTNGLRPQDEIAIAQFGGGFKTLLGWTERSARVLGMGTRGMDIKVQTADSTCAGTNFYNAVERVLDELRSTRNRKGAVLLTDGVHDRIPFETSARNGRGTIRMADSTDDPGFQRVLRAVKASDVVLYFVAVDSDLNPNGSGSAGVSINVSEGPTAYYNPAGIFNMQQVRSRMQQLAEATGGQVVFPKKPQDVGPLFEQIGRELGTSYGLGYASSDTAKDGRYRKIEVRVSGRGYVVRQSRDGYAAPLIR